VQDGCLVRDGRTRNAQSPNSDAPAKIVHVTPGLVSDIDQAS
jgi:hypothetical protein